MLASYSSTTPNLQIGLSEIENARGRQCRQAMRTRLCGGIPADLTFCYFLVKQKVEKKNITNRGFTGHEHYNFFKIINMNGRLYDPVIGRFFSPDNFVLDNTFTQDFNRYSYARNNPLKYIDPTGMIIEYNSFGDRARSFFQRIFDKEFRQDFRDMKNDEKTYVTSWAATTSLLLPFIKKSVVVSKTSANFCRISEEGVDLYVSYLPICT